MSVLIASDLKGMNVLQKLGHFMELNPPSSGVRGTNSGATGSWGSGNKASQQTKATRVSYKTVTASILFSTSCTRILWWLTPTRNIQKREFWEMHSA